VYQLALQALFFLIPNAINLLLLVEVVILTVKLQKIIILNRMLPVMEGKFGMMLRNNVSAL
jgi:hypothetical protein